MPNEDATVDQREYGELISTVKHLTGSIQALQQQQAVESGKLHERLHEISDGMVSRHEHDVLRQDVSHLWQYSRKTRGMVDTASATTREGMRWQERVLFLTMGAGITGAVLAAKILAG